MYSISIFLLLSLTCVTKMVVQVQEQPSSTAPPIEQVSNLSKPPASSETASTSAEVVATFSGRVQRPVPAARSWPNVTSSLPSLENLGDYVLQFIAYLTSKLRLLFDPSTYVLYQEVPLSFETQAMLAQVNRKTLVLDLDETLVHSCYCDPDTNEQFGCSEVPPTAVPDYALDIEIIPEMPKVSFTVFKRPHVDVFLDFVAKWYDLVIYTASLEEYATVVIDQLDAGRHILQRRLYRQHCRSQTNMISKNLAAVNNDLTSVFIIDNSPSVYRDFPLNAVPIKSYIYDMEDMELVRLLPFLDALRFTKDVRTVLGRRESSDEDDL
ncbi:CTD nuclear envelope phosphatase 1 [Drosophila busckii]|uniref:CTD nuclear envelope phosphatase 1 n=1 Tax=Drosophila busckii TaxID=30019 RepID=UPI00083EB5BC|nr:CTD nuclear envelope phosphatase 1 [Drosophila busckii]